MPIADAAIGWHAKSLDPSLASIRLRLLQPLRYLRERGLPVEVYDPVKGVAGYRAVIFSKSMSEEAVDIARALKAAGKLVIYDICDNVFGSKERRRKQERVRLLRTMLSLADIIIFSTPVLRQQILSEVEDVSARTIIIPDMLEDFSDHPVPRRLSDRLRLSALDRFHARHGDALRCIWFGKCQGKKSGLVHVDAAVRELEAFAQSHAVTLTIVGNKRLLYWTASRRWRVPHIYLPWAADSFPQILSRHEVAIIPLERNAYTIGKTINRPATAINAGLGVIADSIDAYEELRPFIAMDDWQAGLRRYSEFRNGSDPHIAEARAHLSARHGEEKVGSAWLHLLNGILAPSQQRVHSASSDSQLERHFSIAQ